MVEVPSNTRPLNHRHRQQGQRYSTKKTGLDAQTRSPQKRPRPKTQIPRVGFHAKNLNTSFDVLFQQGLVRTPTPSHSRHSERTQIIHINVFYSLFARHHQAELLKVHLAVAI